MNQHELLKKTVDELTAAHPVAVKVLQRHRIDFCCGGNRSVSEACSVRGLDPSAFLREVEAEESKRGAEDDWQPRPLSELITHLLDRYHAALREDLPRLSAMAVKVLRVHGEKDPERLAALAETVAVLGDELDVHMIKEEQILFPWILSGRGHEADAPIAVMRQDHQGAEDALVKLSGLTDRYTPPANACGTWRALYEGLSILDADLREHMRLENDILFPRALSGS